MYADAYLEPSRTFGKVFDKVLTLLRFPLSFLEFFVRVLAPFHFYFSFYADVLFLRWSEYLDSEMTRQSSQYL